MANGNYRKHLGNMEDIEQSDCLKMQGYNENVAEVQNLSGADKTEQ